MKAAREAWFAGQLDLDPDRLVFLDETAASTNMARRYGRAPRGERGRMAVPHGHHKTTTVTAALRATGLAATAFLDGATNGTRFRAYVRDTLVPVLKRGNTVILDNLPAHKVAGVREAVEAVGAQPGLPPHRAGVCQAQGAAALSGCPHSPRSLDSHPARLCSLQPRRMPQRPHRRRLSRLRSNPTGNSSSVEGLTDRQSDTAKGQCKSKPFSPAEPLTKDRGSRDHADKRNQQHGR